MIVQKTHADNSSYLQRGFSAAEVVLNHVLRQVGMVREDGAKLRGYVKTLETQARK